MHLSKALPDSVSLWHEDFEWIQSIDYEHVPFHCRKCHMHGHLFRDCPQNRPPTPSRPPNTSDPYGFTKFTHHKKISKNNIVPPKPPQPSSITKDHPSSSNSFHLLASLDPDQNQAVIPSDLVIPTATSFGSLPPLSFSLPDQLEQPSMMAAMPNDNLTTSSSFPSSL